MVVRSAASTRLKNRSQKPTLSASQINIRKAQATKAINEFVSYCHKIDESLYYIMRRYDYSTSRKIAQVCNIPEDAILFMFPNEVIKRAFSSELTDDDVRLIFIEQLMETHDDYAAPKRDGLFRPRR
jgi:hypothetical protein